VGKAVSTAPCRGPLLGRLACGFWVHWPRYLMLAFCLFERWRTLRPSRWPVHCVTGTMRRRRARAASQRVAGCRTCLSMHQATSRSSGRSGPTAACRLARGDRLVAVCSRSTLRSSISCAVMQDWWSPQVSPEQGLMQQCSKFASNTITYALGGPAIPVLQAVGSVYA